ncbi:MAG: DUF1385 domain-containing protein [Ardenticatenales bacterium]|nr:DUF1385 domain-containing protein [Ardenticatenales bacterium]
MSQQEFNYGGQAVIEGVMMRGARHMAVAVRHPEGNIVVHDEPLTAKIYTSRIGKMPFVRGITLLWDALGLGVRALMWSADVALQGEEENKGKEVQFQGAVAWGTVALSLSMGIGLFFVLPLFLTGLLDRWLETFIVGEQWLNISSNVLEGAIRLSFFITYLLAIGQMEDIKRVFAYHGAEHKTIHAYEAGVALTPANVRPFSLLHPRCGTGFLLVVMVLSIFIFVLLGRPPLIWRIVSRIVLIPLIAGIAYEFLRWSAARYSNPVVRALITPSLMLQKLTTREPDDSMLEVAITSLKTVLVKEGVLPIDEETEEALEGETTVKPVLV